MRYSYSDSRDVAYSRIPAIHKCVALCLSRGPRSLLFLEHVISPVLTFRHTVEVHRGWSLPSLKWHSSGVSCIRRFGQEGFLVWGIVSLGGRTLDNFHSRLSSLSLSPWGWGSIQRGYFFQIHSGIKGPSCLPELHPEEWFPHCFL